MEIPEEMRGRARHDILLFAEDGKVLMKDSKPYRLTYHVNSPKRYIASTMRALERVGLGKLENVAELRPVAEKGREYTHVLTCSTDGVKKVTEALRKLIRRMPNGVSCKTAIMSQTNFCTTFRNSTQRSERLRWEVS